MSTKPTSPLPFVKAPPPFTLPAVPSGTVTVQSAKVRAQLPRKEELALIPDVQTELQRFTDYAAVFGKTAPARAAVEQTLSSAYQWSTLRRLLTAWTAYALAQETESWVAARNLLGRLSSAFGLAVKTDSTIGESCPSLGQLFGVRATIAQRGAAVRKANAQAVSEGKPAYKGAAGKRRQKADAKAALLAQQAAEAHAVPSTSAVAAGAGPRQPYAFRDEPCSGDRYCPTCPAMPVTKTFGPCDVAAEATDGPRGTHGESRDRTPPSANTESAPPVRSLPRGIHAPRSRRTASNGQSTDRNRTLPGC